MKRLFVLLVIAILLGTAAYVVSGSIAKHACGVVMEKHAEMQWLRTKFKLTDAQFARISALHAQYEPVCDVLCDRIAESNKKVAGLIRANTVMTPELEAALRESAQVNADCRKALLGHVYAVANEMDPDQGRLYIAMMQERLVQMGGE